MVFIICSHPVFPSRNNRFTRSPTKRFMCLKIYLCHWVLSDYAYDIAPPHVLTHWGRATHICVSKLTIIASDNGLSPGRRQAIIRNNAGILSIGLLGTNFSEILIEIHKFSFKKMRLKVSSAKWWPCCLGLNVLKRPWGSSPASLFLRFIHHLRVNNYKIALTLKTNGILHIRTLSSLVAAQFQIQFETWNSDMQYEFDTRFSALSWSHCCSL